MESSTCKRWEHDMNDAMYLKPPCPPTRESLIDHFRKCIAAAEHPATRAELEEELRKVLAQ